MPWIKVAKVTDIPDGEIHSLSAGDGKLAVAHIGSEFFAIDDACTHLHCSLGKGMVVGGQVECSCHGARFDLATGEVRALPAIAPVKTYPLKVEGEEILVEI